MDQGSRTAEDGDGSLAAPSEIAAASNVSGRPIAGRTPMASSHEKLVRWHVQRRHVAPTV
jgi:hypothetical protein